MANSVKVTKANKNAKSREPMVNGVKFRHLSERRIQLVFVNKDNK